jgi:hypothetical protein
LAVEGYSSQEANPFQEVMMMDSDEPENPSEFAEVEGSTEAQPAEDQLRRDECGKPVSISRRKLEANRRNGTKGGVKTEEGKRKSRRNAMKHGMRASTLLLEEDGSESEKLRAARAELSHEFTPRTFTECTLVDQLVLALQRMRCGRNFEESELTLDSPFHHPGIDRLLRYSREANRQFFRALAELQKLRGEETNEGEEE